MTRDTAIGGEAARFPETRHSAIRGLQDRDAGLRRQSYECLIAAYWKPAYKYLRLRWNKSNDQAKDLTQAFFTSAIEDETLTRYDPAQASFRTYLRSCLDHFVLNARQYDQRIKRAGDTSALSLDFTTAEGEIRDYALAAPDSSLDDVFHREWVRSVFALAIEDLRSDCQASGRTVPFAVFAAYDLSDADPRPTYADVAARLSLTTAAVTNHLAAMRRDLRKAVLAKLRELTATEREFRSEARALLGVEPA